MTYVASAEPEGLINEKAAGMLLQLINDKNGEETMDRKIVMQSRVIVNDAVNKRS